MTLTGHVENGRIVLDDSVELTEGMKVRVELLQAGPTNEKRADDRTDESTPTFYERHKSWIGSVKDAPADYAKNLDHYLYGLPKK